jgi:hypothetical protein
MELSQFAQLLHEVPELRTTVDRAVAILWLAGRDTPSTGLTAKEIATSLEAGGYPALNITRLQRALIEDSRTANAGGGAFRLRPAARVSLEQSLARLIGPRRAAGSDSLIPRDLVNESRRDYLKRVVHQANGAYDAELYDCSAVMLRRLVETLIIEAFESAGIAHQIKNSQGHFFMLNDLLAALIREHNRFHIGRNSQRGLSELKELGDKSAHNRRFNATRSDIDRLRNDIRTAVEELLHLAGLIPDGGSSAA